MRTYTVVVERDPETRVYVGYVPGWPGAHSQGDSVEELRANLQEVIVMLLDVTGLWLRATTTGSRSCALASAEVFTKRGEITGGGGGGTVGAISEVLGVDDSGATPVAGAARRMATLTLGSRCLQRSCDDGLLSVLVIDRVMLWEHSVVQDPTNEDVLASPAEEQDVASSFYLPQAGPNVFAETAYAWNLS